MNEENISEQNKSGEENFASSITLPVIEEHIEVQKKIIEAAKVNISKTIEKSIETIDVPLLHEEIIIERIPINEYVNDPPPAVRYEGDTMILPVLKEVLITEKRLMLVEEIKILKKQLNETKKEEVVLRKEKINIERKENNAETKNL